MKQDFTQQLINTWDWLSLYCQSKRDDKALACGRHALCIVQVDDFSDRRTKWGPKKTEEVLSQLEDIMSEYAMDDTLVAKYDESTYAVILHYLDSDEEAQEICEEIKSAINNAGLGGDVPLTVSIGASRCRHDQEQGYQCAVGYALEALLMAQKQKTGIEISKEI